MDQNLGFHSLGEDGLEALIVCF